MTVYIDNAFTPFGRMKMCHMIADTEEELHAMAFKIGMKRSWFQNDPEHPHYDVSMMNRLRAVAQGAKEITQREMVLILREKRRKAMEEYYNIEMNL